jgi:hypothetical protein
MPGAKFEKKILSFSNVRKRHTSKVLIIFNLLRSYYYGSYSQMELSSFTFEIDLKYGMNFGRCEHQKRKIQLHKCSKIHKSTVFLLLNNMRSY